jgi:glycosyltransferase involved in cell wall biosynthesis
MKYALPENVGHFQVVPLAPRLGRPGLSQPLIDVEAYADLLYGITREGSIEALDALAEMAARPVRRSGLGRLARPAPPGFSDLLCSERAWAAMVACYGRIAPHASFPDFFWAWRSLVGGLLSVATAPVPRARVYHAISTGYAGLYAVRAARQNAARSAITEHGIYTNERRIDLMMADWITDTVRSSLAGGDGRTDVRAFWIETFESYARLVYAGADKVTTLYGANQSFQRSLGAREETLQVIPNGIVLERFDTIERGQAKRPTVALIGRVVPIKDVETYIAAAAVVKKAIPGVEFLLIGPTDEDEEYFALCQRRIDELGLGDTVVFTGRVEIVDYLGRIDVLVLTSISEAQPLVLLEAGAARVPCVVTDVGSCREIIEGAPDEAPNLGIAGRVAPPMDAAAIGQAIAELLGDPDLRRQCGETLRRRVQAYFTSDLSARRYAALYEELMAA